jgi:hypothetical protein
LLLAGGPRDARCLLYVTKALDRAFTRGKFWTELEPFDGWNEFVDLVNKNAPVLENKYDHVKPPPIKRVDKVGNIKRLNPMYGLIDKHPLWAMLCATHEDEDPELRADYAHLQMHILYARWREACHKGKGKAQAIRSILTATGSARQMRVAIPLGKAARALSTRKFSDLLKALEPSNPPELFREHLKTLKEAFASEAGDIFKTIFHHVVKERDARHDGTGGGSPRNPRREGYPEYIEYDGDRIGIRIERNDEDGFNSEAVFQMATPGPPDPADTDEETRNKEQHQFRSPLEAATTLGVHAAELGNRVKLRSHVPGAKSAGQARHIARARRRSTEIDRDLMPWSSDRLSLREFHKIVIPQLESTLKGTNIPIGDLKSATLVAISIDTGRPMKDVVELQIERRAQMAKLSFQPPRGAAESCGIWKWDPVGPDYTSTFDVPRSMEMNRAPALRYRASRLVTELILQYRRMAKFRTRPFGGDIDHVAEALGWINRQSGWENVTPARLARLRWQALHEATAGELASSCLILGRQAYLASVELHYAALEMAEAGEKFDESSKALWNEEPANSLPLAPAEPTIVGIRAVPKISLVQETVARLQSGSRGFFQIAPRTFDPLRHGNLLNAAVLYAVWHQFFCFATRAIRDAYQERSLFAEGHQVSILADKDFDDHHKTRLIWADKRLLKHMKRIEERLDAVRQRLTNHRFPKNSPLFFLDDGSRALRITPKTVADQLGAEFPFEVNAPRKLMRFLVRKAGLSHEEAEVFMGHCWEAREPWSPFSSFDWQRYLARVSAIVPDILEKLGFTWIPGEGAR